MMNVIAHAGCDDQYPPNTLTALELSAPHVDMIEIDLRRCGSGEIVLFHDEKITRTSGDDQQLDNISLDALQGEIAAEINKRIPTLQEALETVPADVGLNLEFKEPGLITDVKRLTDKCENDLLISSFRKQTLEAVLEHNWDVQVASLFEVDPISNIQKAYELGCNAVHPQCKLCINSNIVQLAKELRLEINAWTIESKEIVRDLSKKGVDGVIIDNWELV